MKYENCYLSKDLALGSNVIMVSPNMLDYSVVVYQICVLN